MMKDTNAIRTTKCRISNSEISSYATAVQHEKFECNNLQTSNVHGILSEMNTVIRSAV